jgi:hypothetical protein
MHPGIYDYSSSNWQVEGNVYPLLAVKLIEDRLSQEKKLWRKL